MEFIPKTQAAAKENTNIGRVIYTSIQTHRSNKPLYEHNIARILHYWKICKIAAKYKFLHSKAP